MNDNDKHRRNDEPLLVKFTFLDGVFVRIDFFEGRYVFEGWQAALAAFLALFTVVIVEMLLAEMIIRSIHLFSWAQWWRLPS